LGCLPGSALIILTLMAVITAVNTGRHRDPGSGMTPPPTAPEAAAVWSVEAQELRHDLRSPEFVSSLDGDFDGSYVAATAGIWLTITGARDDTDTVLQAMEPSTGKPVWQRRLDGVLCATEATPAGIACASVTRRDPATGLGIGWRLHLLDPRTGRDRRTREVSAWVTAVHLAGDTFVLLEQRQPAPHAVVRGFDAASLRPRWTADLAHVTGQAELFSTNRVIKRHEPDRPGLALDRPRIKDVGGNLVAIWAGQRTAFVRRDTGRLVGLPHCSRLVDDGHRLWCNEPDAAVAYSYRLRRLVRTDAGVRLLFADDDGIGADRHRPVFANEAGDLFSVDPRTGHWAGPYARMGTGSAFGLVIMPQSHTAGDDTFVSGAAGMIMLDRRSDTVRWRNPKLTDAGQPILHGGRLLVGAGDLAIVDPTDGRMIGELRQSHGLYTVDVGGRIAGIGPDEIALIKI
jgi:hypothetical protein